MQQQFSGLLQPRLVPNVVWEEDLSLDCITGFLKSKRYEAVLVAVNILSKLKGVCLCLFQQENKRDFN